MSFLASIPIIGTFFEKIGEAIDRNVTSDEERLQLKAELTQHHVPIISAVVEAQKSFNEMQVAITRAEIKSEHWLVWARRPFISILATVNFMVTMWLSIGGMVEKTWVELAFYFAMAASGLDMGTRGLEKVVKGLKAKEQI